MKKNSTKRDFGKFTKRNTHKRRGKEAQRHELEKLLEKTNINAKDVHLSSVSDIGRFGRASVGYSDREAVGVFCSSKNGYGFVRMEEGRDIFIPQGRSMHALDGDLVEVEYRCYTNRFGEEKTEGRVKKIVEYGRKTVIGTLTRELVLFTRKRRGYVFLLDVDDPKITERIRIESTLGASEGEKVEVKLIRSREIYGDVVRILGDAESFGANYEAHLAECGIEVDFSPAAISEAKEVAAEKITTDGREDFRRMTVFTIDGESAKDLDDAVSLRRLPSGAWQLGVHIADVSHYVKERTPLDRAAMSRATSVYFTDKVVPMLPPVISNGACSLNSGEDKYVLSAIMNISAGGELLSTKIVPAIINSRVRGVYSEINSIFDKTASVEILKKYKSVIPTLEKMHELYLVLKEKSKKRGALELEAAEASVLLTPDGMPLDIVKRERKDAEMMIEQFMLAANESVAKYLSERGIPCVYRIHEPPPEDKLRELVNYVHNLGFDTAFISMSRSSTSDISALLKEADARGLAVPVGYTVLRSMSKARYSEIRQPHYGLGIDFYCHFTSPIRRLSDLATHRIIHKVLIDGKNPDKYASYAKRAAVAATEGEIRAVNAERRIENMYKALYMSNFVGEDFVATVNSVTSFGLFVELENTCEGLVPISEMGMNFVFDEKNLTIRSGREAFHLADRVYVKLEEVDVMRGKMRFSVISKVEDVCKKQ